MSDLENAAQDPTEAAQSTESTENIDSTKEKKAVAATIAAEVSTTDVPEKYDLKLPDHSLMDKSRLADIAELAKERGLSNKDAQEIVDRESKVVSDYQNDLISQVEDSRIEWKEEAKADKEIGGEKFKESVELSNRVLKKFGTDTLSKMLKDTGFEDHPEWIRLTRRIGEAMGDDKLVLGSSKSSGQQKQVADVLYSNGKTA